MIPLSSPVCILFLFVAAMALKWKTECILFALPKYKYLLEFPDSSHLHIPLPLLQEGLLQIPTCFWLMGLLTTQPAIENLLNVYLQSKMGSCNKWLITMAVLYVSTCQCIHIHMYNLAI